MLATHYLARWHHLMEAGVCVCVCAEVEVGWGGVRVGVGRHARWIPGGTPASPPLWLDFACACLPAAAAFHFSTCIRPQRGPLETQMYANQSQSSPSLLGKPLGRPTQPPIPDECITLLWKE